MHPVLFKIPGTELTIWSYGLMMVIGFLAAVTLIRRLSRNITSDPQLITNAALYSLIADVLGARLFYVVHYFEKFRGNLFSIFAIWEGGLELLGGVLLAIAVIVLYLRHQKQPVRRYLDILAIGLFAALAFGRIGCFFNGCCYGKPTDLAWGIRFPYDSPAYTSQVFSNEKRNRPEPYMELPDEFFEYIEREGLWYSQLKPYEKLTYEQKILVDKGPYRSLAVHPTQLFSAANGGFLCLMLYLFWRKGMKRGDGFIKPGYTFAMMFVLYGFTRFFMEFVRDDNPFEFDSITISQNIGIGMVILGVVLMAIFKKMGPDKFGNTS